MYEETSRLIVDIFARNRSPGSIAGLDINGSIGLYESTAIVAQGDKFEVIGDGKVAIIDGKEREGKKYYLLSTGERFDLKTRAKL
ncbi:MAG TPA: hypothetical protein VJ810_03955 [Blastocatellia bacterium]|nr:hypothetical protein [Blastocatellia bacterium]